MNMSHLVQSITSWNGIIKESAIITGIQPAAIASISVLWASRAPRIIKQNIPD